MSSNSTASRLDRLIGLGTAKQIVTSLYRSQTETHAILFYGPEGCGKDELAHIMAGYWLCNQPTPELGADGVCRACGALGRSHNPDLLFIAPMGPGNQITIKQLEVRPNTEESITPLQQFVRTSPLLSRKKVVIISEAERMNEDSANTLLKTLEEPPNFLKLILVTSSAGSIRPTILSRVLGISCALPLDAELRQAFPSATSDDILVSESAPGRLAKVLANPKPYRDLVNFARSLLRRSKGEALIASEELRTIAEQLEKSLGSGMRAANAEVFRTLSLVFAREAGFPASWAQATIVAHDRILGNVNAALVMDAFFATGLS